MSMPILPKLSKLFDNIANDNKMFYMFASYVKLNFCNCLDALTRSFSFVQWDFYLHCQFCILSTGINVKDGKCIRIA